jgi:hypothetical protein
MEILKFKVSNLRNEEHYMFHLDFSGLVTQYTPAALGIEPMYPAYLAALRAEEQSLNVIKASAITSELTDADTRRDYTFSGLLGTIRSAMKHFDPEISKSAARLKMLLGTYGYVPSKPYDQETAALIKLVSELEGPYAPDVAKLGIAGWVEKLKTQNTEFDNLKNQRYGESTLKPQQNLKQARIVTDNAYRNMVKLINALMVVNGAAQYEAFVGALNQRIENYRRVLAQRQGRNAEIESPDEQTEGA